MAFNFRSGSNDGGRSGRFHSDRVSTWGRWRRVQRNRWNVKNQSREIIEEKYIYLKEYRFECLNFVIFVCDPWPWRPSQAAHETTRGQNANK